MTTISLPSFSGCCARDRSHDGGSARDAAEHAFFPGEPARHLERLVVAYGDHVVDHVHIQDVRNEPAPSP